MAASAIWTTWVPFLLNYCVEEKQVSLQLKPLVVCFGLMHLVDVPADTTIKHF
jgi:hypothetical protein